MTAKKISIDNAKHNKPNDCDHVTLELRRRPYSVITAIYQVHSMHEDTLTCIPVAKQLSTRLPQKFCE